MKTVVLIKEESHGMIGVAKDYPSAIDFLVNENWLDGNCELYEGDGIYKTVEEKLGENWKEEILSWDTEQFGEFFDGSFYLTIEGVYGT